MMNQQNVHRHTQSEKKTHLGRFQRVAQHRFLAAERHVYSRYLSDAGATKTTQVWECATPLGTVLSTPVGFPSCWLSVLQEQHKWQFNGRSDNAPRRLMDQFIADKSSRLIDKDDGSSIR
mmetsp:Transcript_11391/g.16708  ORF Transcript_11391/g.16708 Transcript_11391/m.16708 type:complete len:120 (+) Transcript_11391:1259-1618(+)